MKTINIKGKEYVPVVERIKEAHKLDPEISITTEVISDDTLAVIKATVIFKGKTFTGHSQAEWNVGMMGKVALEVAETSAIGRALGFANIGLLDGIASADEMRKVSKKQAYNEKNKADYENGVDPLADEEEFEL
jgi:hypothetical protein